MFKLYILLFLVYVVYMEHNVQYKINNQYKKIKKNKECTSFLEKLYRMCIWRFSFIASTIIVSISFTLFKYNNLLPNKDINMIVFLIFTVSYQIISTLIGYIQWHYIIDGSHPMS